MIIKPTVGRVVWFHPGAAFTGKVHENATPLAATVAYVWGDRMVNLSVTDHNGAVWPVTSVTLVQEGDQAPNGHWCEWMPYQVGQAKKHDPLQGAIVGGERVGNAIGIGVGGNGGTIGGQNTGIPATHRTID